MIKEAKNWIDKLGLQKHPEGGWFKEIYRSEETISVSVLPKRYSGDRNFSTSIYYLLAGNDFSHLHRIKSVEIWHFYAGSSSIEIWMLVDKKLIKKRVGKDIENGEEFQVVVPENTWFTARLIDSNGYALVGCTISPGFHFDDFEMADDKILSKFLQLANEIKEMVKQ